MATSRKHKRVHVHFEDSISKPGVFRITKERLAAAQRRHRASASMLRVTHGEDFKTLETWLPDAEGLVCSADFLVHPRFPLRSLERELPGLRWIHTIGAGIEKLLPLDWIHPGVRFTNNSGVHRAKMYEFALMALTMLNARVPEIFTHQRQARWQQVFTPQVRGRQLVVVGTGDLGGAFAKAGKHLGMRVTGLSRSGRAAPGFDSVRRIAALPQVLAKTDILVIAAPLTAQTRGLVGAGELRALKKGAALVNVGRGPILDTAALVDALESGHVSGAILDVFDQEPLPAGSPLWQAPNLYVSPHCSSDDADRYIPLTLDLAFENARRLALGRPLLNVVDPRTQY